MIKSLKYDLILQRLLYSWKFLSLQAVFIIHKKGIISPALVVVSL